MEGKKDEDEDEEEGEIDDSGLEQKVRLCVVEKFMERHVLIGAGY